VIRSEELGGDGFFRSDPCRFCVAMDPLPKESKDDFEGSPFSKVGHRRTITFSRVAIPRTEIEP